MGRPSQYPRQIVMHVAEPVKQRIDADAAERGDGSKSAAARRLMRLGILLADFIAEPENQTNHRCGALDDLLDEAEGMRE